MGDTVPAAPRKDKGDPSSGCALIGSDIVARRVEKLDEIRRMLMAIIPRERARLIRPAKR
jgi:hypothetical protein